MGYKLAGYDLLGNCEIDPEMMGIYKRNHSPRFPFLMDIRDLARKEDLPEELFSLDVLDGSPPCSVFSTAGKRQAGWGKEKRFREGQRKQRLDDLFFAYIDLVARLRPKVAVAENVYGLVKGKARGYVNEIIKGYGEAGYDVQIFYLNSALMGVPQERTRVFFIARRKDLGLPRIELSFSERPIVFGKVRSREPGDSLQAGLYRSWLPKRRKGDSSFKHISERERGNQNGFGSRILSDWKVPVTLTSGGTFIRMCDGTKLTRRDIVSIQSFPEDYDFMGADPQYVCGMSVPPVMMANIASEIHRQWLSGMP